MMDARNRFPWTPAEEQIVRVSKARRIRHKVIARELQRTPRAVDQHVAQMKERGLLAMHRREELELLARIEAEERQPERHPYEIGE